MALAPSASGCGETGADSLSEEDQNVVAKKRNFSSRYIQHSPDRQRKGLLYIYMIYNITLLYQMITRIPVF